MRVSNRAILMWFFENLFSKVGVVVFILLFLSLVSFIWLAPQIKDFSPVFQQLLIVDKWLMLGLAVVALFLVLSALFIAFNNYNSLSFGFEENAFKIASGILKIDETFIPYRNIQNVDIRRNEWELFWGLASVLIWTSSAGDAKNPSLAEGYIPGLSYKSAQELTKELLARIGK